MNGIVIYINWEYFLGLIGALIGIAYYANGRFTTLETSVDWLTETLRGLTIASENELIKLFNARSPVRLTRTGERLLSSSGLRSYIDAQKDRLDALSSGTIASDPYERQSQAFRLLADLPFDPPFERQLKEFAYSHGISTDLLRRLGAIYFRDRNQQASNDGAV
jgi:hypothetical protein